MTITTSTSQHRFSWLQRLLNTITEVRYGEAKPALMLFTTIFLVLCAYYFIKPVREGWLSVSLVSGLEKMEVKAYSSFAQTMILLAVIPFYAMLTTLWVRRDLISRVGLFFAVNLLLFWIFHPGLLFDQVPYLGLVFYVWTGIFSVTLVAQFWSFAADIYGVESGKRLFPLCVRLGDGLVALTVLIGTRGVRVEAAGFILFNMVLIGIWFVLGVLVVREHRRLVRYPVQEASA